MDRLLFIALGGALGALSRYGIGVLLQRFAPGFPWGVLVVNIGGSFMFGIVWAISVERGWLSDNARDVILIGFMGALTTFSTFAFNNLQLAYAGAWFPLSMNILANNAAGLAVVWFGIRLVRLFP